MISYFKPIYRYLTKRRKIIIHKFPKPPIRARKRKKSNIFILLKRLFSLAYPMMLCFPKKLKPENWVIEEHPFFISWSFFQSYFKIQI